MLKVNPKAEKDEQFIYKTETLIELAQEARSIIAKSKRELETEYKKDDLIWLNSTMKEADSVDDAEDLLMDFKRLKDKARILPESYFLPKLSSTQREINTLKEDMLSTINFVFCDTSVLSGTTKTPDEYQETESFNES
jgi:hypothetical protein